MNKKNNPLFDKFRKKLVVEAWLKSFLMSIAIAGAVSAVVGLVLWFTAVKGGVWYTLGTLLVLTGAFMPTFYFLRYRPDDMDIARRLDRMGLDERMITMTEFGEVTDGEYAIMLEHQREDAVQALDTSVRSGKKLSIAISGLVAIPVVAALVLSGGMMTVNALADKDIIPSGNKVIESIANAEDEKFYTVNYKVVGLEMDASGYISAIMEDEGGYIDGNDEQLVLVGGSATPVYAEAEDDFLFVCWGSIDTDKTKEEEKYLFDNDMTDPYREDLEVIAEGANWKTNEDGETVITYAAYFVRMPEGESDGGEGGGDNSEDQEGDQDAPSDEPQEGDDSQQQPSGGDSSGDENGDTEEGGGQYSSDKDNIIDGTQDYRGVYEQYLQEALEIINNGGELPESMKKLIEEYFGIIV